MKYKLFVGSDFDGKGGIAAVVLAGVVDNEEPTTEDVRKVLDGFYEDKLEDQIITLESLGDFGYTVLEDGEPLGLLLPDVEGWGDEE